MFATDAPPSPSGATSTRILDFFLSDLSEDQLERLILGAMQRNTSIQLTAIDLFMSSDSPQLLELVKKGLLSYGLFEGSLVQKCLEAIQGQPEPSRMLILAEFLGGHAGNREVLDFVEKGLAGVDEELQASLMENLRFYHFADQDEERMAAHLQRIALTGGPATLRAAALSSLRGIESPKGVRFLLGRALQDPDTQVRLQAVRSLPNLSSDEDMSLREEAIFTLHAIFRDPGLAPKLRWTVTHELHNLTRDYKGSVLSKEALEEIVAAKAHYDEASEKTKDSRQPD